MFLNFYFDVSGKSGLSGSTFTFFNDKGLFVGNNTDVKSLIMRILLRHTKSIVVEMNILGRNKFTYVSFPFFVGVVNGFNENIILSSHKILRKDNKFVNGRLGIFILSRYLLENSKDISEIRNIIPKNLPGKSMNLMVTDIGRKKSSVFEISSGGVNELTIKGQWMGCTNHIKSEKMRDLYAGLPEASEVVLKSLETLLSEVEEMTVDKSVSILQNKGSGLKGRFGNSSVANNATCQSFVFDFENMEMHISNSNKRPVSLNGKFVKISF
jgi:hypothetical protein